MSQTNDDNHDGASCASLPFLTENVLFLYRHFEGRVGDTSMHKSKGSCKLLDLKGGRLHHVNNECPHQDCCKEQHDIHAWSSQSSWEMQPEEAPAHRQNGKAEEPKRPACSLQPTRSEI